jgi:tRNA/tmRNA/rRNA uracil-C5-methylase (TrmA/RlmC/RlmD family)
MGRKSACQIKKKCSQFLRGGGNIMQPSYEEKKEKFKRQNLKKKIKHQELLLELLQHAYVWD